MTGGPPEEKATVREVYSLVNEVRDDLVDRIDNLSSKLDTVVQNHEHRLTTNEAVQAQQNLTLDRHASRLDRHSGRIDALEIAHQRALGHLGAWKVVAGVGGGALTIVVADLIIKALGG